MTSEERTAAKKISRIMRAARKELGLTQEMVSSRLGISQSALSKLEHGSLVPSAPQWFEFCEMTHISTDSLISGYIEKIRPADLIESAREGSFKLPRKYARHRGSKVRALLPFLDFLQNSLGEEKLKEFLVSSRMDPDFFINLDNQISLEFCLDVARSLIQKKYLKAENISNLTRPVNTPSMHGFLRGKYGQEGNKKARLQLLLSNSKSYECNFHYTVQDLKPDHVVFSIRPEEHLEESSYRHDPDLGDFLCRYKKSYFERFTTYGEGNDVVTPQIDEVECHYHGAPKCVYRIELAS